MKAASTTHPGRELAVIAVEHASDESIAGNLLNAVAWLQLAVSIEPGNILPLPYIAAFQRALKDTREAETWKHLSALSPESATRARYVLDHVDRFLETKEPELKSSEVGELGPDALLWVLGYRLKSTGAPRRRLIARLQTTAVLAFSNPTINVLVSGGAAGKTPYTEASVMAAFLTEWGLGADRLYEERCSRETLENVVMARPWLTGRHGTVVLISEDPHLVRAAALLDLTGWADSMICVTADEPTPITAIDIAGTYRDCLRLAGFPMYENRAVDMAQSVDP